MTDNPRCEIHHLLVGGSGLESHSRHEQDATLYSGENFNVFSLPKILRIFLFNPTISLCGLSIIVCFCKNLKSGNYFRIELFSILEIPLITLAQYQKHFCSPSLSIPFPSAHSDFGFYYSPYSFPLPNFLPHHRCCNLSEQAFPLRQPIFFIQPSLMGVGKYYNG